MLPDRHVEYPFTFRRYCMTRACRKLVAIVEVCAPGVYIRLFCVMFYMKTQIKVLGTIDILLGVYFLWTLWGFMYESTTAFVQKEFTMTMFFAGLIIGGIGLWTRRKVGWIANQMTGIHIILSAVVGMVFANERISNNETTFIFPILILIIGGRLFWTNKRQWLDEFRLSNKVRIMTICFGTIISLVLLLKSYV